MNSSSEHSATDKLRTLILSLELMPGMGLSERGLEETLDASRTPIRAALSRLESEGLTHKHGRSWRVAPIDLTEIRAAMEFREAIEAGAIALAAERASLDDLQAMLHALDTPDTDAPEQGIQSGAEFHLSLASLTRNPFYVDAMRDIFTRLARTRWLEVRTPESRAAARFEHRAILEALVAGDAPRATMLAITHTRGTQRRLLETLESEHFRLRGRGLAIIESDDSRQSHAS